MEKKYWNNFYNGQTKISAIDFPSQFALFVLPDLIERKANTLFDLGCGNGRDTSYFSKFIKNVYGFDASDSAISQANKSSTKEIYHVADLTNGDLSKNFSKVVDVHTVFYSRFFLHALTNDEIKSFVHNISRLMPTDSYFYIEFRTCSDRHGSKITDKHYRNYIETDKFEILVAPYFHVEYKVSGLGMAKYRNDDAFIARYILKRI